MFEIGKEFQLVELIEKLKELRKAGAVNVTIEQLIYQDKPDEVKYQFLSPELWEKKSRVIGKEEYLEMQKNDPSLPDWEE